MLPRIRRFLGQFYQKIPVGNSGEGHHTVLGISYIDNQMFRQRLKIKNDVKELWWHLRSRLKRLAQSGVSVDNLLDDFSHQVKL